MLQRTLFTATVVSASFIGVSAFTSPQGHSALSQTCHHMHTSPTTRPLSPRVHVTNLMATIEEATTTSDTAASSNKFSGSNGSSRQTTSKLRQLKDRMWVRETLEDITAAEFASSLSVEEEIESPNNSNSKNSKQKIWEGKKKKTRAVDFDNILNKLDLRIEEMCVLTSPEIAKEMNQTCHILNKVVKVETMDGKFSGETIIENACYSLADSMGTGSAVYTQNQREALLRRLIGTRERLVNFIEKGEQQQNNNNGDNGGVVDDIRSQLEIDDSTKEEDGVEKIMKKQEETDENKANGATFDTSLYVREDGTVDWDGALQDREALKKFGSAVWSRINGQDPEAGGEEEEKDGEEVSEGGGGGDDFSHAPKVTAKIEETDAIREKRAMLEKLEDELDRMEVEHTKLLNSAIGASQAVANVNLATVNASLRKQIRDSSELLEKKQAEVTQQMLNYELERIYTYLEGELGNTAAKGYIPLQDRLNVAEFGLLESQLDSFNRQIELGENFDSDVLAVVSDQLVDFKRRLGIDYYVTGLTFDMEAIQIWLKDSWVKTKDGLAFYVKGCRLFWDDLVFSTSLILKASQGYTLKPREVRTLRRAFKDTITFIPVVIILIIPLSPIGHVLVFGAIQRVFPDFFPSCFTERRQNLLELYESTEYTAVTINETWTQKLVRISAALKVLTVQMFTDMIRGGDLDENSDENKDSSQKESS